ncbi:hypothetical protein [Jannaschia sp. 2305UL9-9]|uniref:hypothetical protein n=1 Tax=Jannaschia sp. 2305UL9-9 TaxID=3121638 RepID=UPI003526FDEF
MKIDTKTTGRSDVSERLDSRAASALRSMETLRDVLDRKVAELEQAPVDGLKPDDLLRLQRELAKAVTLAVEQEGKVADARRDASEGDGLDLAGARAEVRRRLDLLLERGGA